MPSDIKIYKESLIGLRTTNEDIETYKQNANSNGKAIDESFAPINLFIICDGHGGKEVAAFVVPILKKHLMNPECNYPLTHQEIIKIYNYIQKELINHPKNIAENCGCTALVTVIYYDKGNRNLQVINIGDSRSVICNDGFAIPLCKDHKPYWPEEKKRIDKVNLTSKVKRKIHFDAGDWRVGDLSVSRSFGDLYNTPHVTHIPQSFTYSLLKSDKFIVMACDGVWDVISNQEVVNFVRDNIDNNNISFYKLTDKITHKITYPTASSQKSKNLATKLAEYAIAKGSTDNISIIIIILK